MQALARLSGSACFAGMDAPRTKRGRIAFFKLSRPSAPGGQRHHHRARLTGNGDVKTDYPDGTRGSPRIMSRRRKRGWGLSPVTRWLRMEESLLLRVGVFFYMSEDCPPDGRPPHDTGMLEWLFFCRVVEPFVVRGEETVYEYPWLVFALIPYPTLPLHHEPRRRRLAK